MKEWNPIYGVRLMVLIWTLVAAYLAFVLVGAEDTSITLSNLGKIFLFIAALITIASIVISERTRHAIAQFWSWVAVISSAVCLSAAVMWVGLIFTVWFSIFMLSLATAYFILDDTPRPEKPKPKAWFRKANRFKDLMF